MILPLPKKKKKKKRDTPDRCGLDSQRYSTASLISPLFSEKTQGAGQREGGRDAIHFILKVGGGKRWGLNVNARDTNIFPVARREDKKKEGGEEFVRGKQEKADWRQRPLFSIVRGTKGRGVKIQ